MDPAQGLCYIGVVVSWYSRNSLSWSWVLRLTPLLAWGGLLFLLLANHGSSWMTPPRPHKAKSEHAAAGTQLQARRSVFQKGLDWDRSLTPNSLCR